MSEVRGLEDFWARRTGRAPPGPLTMAERILLDARGLGLEQVLTYLRDWPDFATFAAWIAATAGPPDAERIARYHAWLAGDPVPEATRVRLAAIDAMPPVLDADEIAHWEAHGYVILRGAIGRGEAAAAAELLWRVAGADPGDPATWHGQRNNGIMVQHFCDPALDIARYSPRVHKAFAQLWGRSDLWSIVDRMSFSAPPAPGRPWQGPLLHWDVSLALPIPFATQGILYLTDTAADQGATQVVPGFHHRIEAWLKGLGDADPRAVDLSAEGVTIPAGAGDLVIWRQDLPHGASPNRAARPRLAQYVNMYPADLETNPEWR
ncbi:phytanoyl-CoA dioxygenase family protein [Sphingomonas immobilis]|uniref:Phytanoyl-CoA dioxygenase family protein n=1 Tax=Sphingomonas immobilis TaxID=3063997 RepID=A0ABT8ZU03_9SPHN|nr:phytanoyl-CoA dioxygenase family protein [Sphingomonas sp. CA1-15]MDO7841045.1 phytanoyl-CoA dioxygenase family protein [Sphingomonas sp. CA1-15]